MDYNFKTIATYVKKRGDNLNDISALVEKIAQEVLKRIELNPPKTLLIGPGGFMEEVLKKSAICYAYHSDYSEDMDIEDYNFIIIQGMSNFQLVTSSLLVPGTNISKLILRAGLTGKKVYVESDSIEYKRYEDTIDKGLKEKFESYEKSIAQYGVKILKAQSIVDDIQAPEVNISVRDETASQQQVHQSTECCTLSKRLITEQDLRKVIQQGKKTVRIGKNSLITPLAKDYIKINNICLIKE